MLSTCNENISNFCKPDDLHKKKPKPLYKSQNVWNRILEDEKGSKYSHKTMGQAEVSLPRPSEFLKKRLRECFNQETGKPQRQSIDAKKPSVPTHYLTHQQKQHHHSKVQGNVNVCLENIKKISNMQPQKKSPRIVFTRTGHTQTLEQSCLLPRHVFQEDFGKVPEYIKEYQREEEEKQNQRKNIEEEQKVINKNELLLRQEEHKLKLERLKASWVQKNKEFLLLPVVTDILARIRRRFNLEKELADLETEIESLERYKF